MNKQRGFSHIELLLALIALCIAVVGVGGWVWNIVKLSHGTFTVVTPELILRLLGVVVPPLGVVMGWL